MSRASCISCTVGELSPLRDNSSIRASYDGQGRIAEARHNGSTSIAATVTRLDLRRDLELECAAHADGQPLMNGFIFNVPA